VTAFPYPVLQPVTSRIIYHLLSFPVNPIALRTYPVNKQDLNHHGNSIPCRPGSAMTSRLRDENASIRRQPTGLLGKKSASALNENVPPHSISKARPLGLVDLKAKSGKTVSRTPLSGKAGQVQAQGW
jgi:hypothetical protein